MIPSAIAQLCGLLSRQAEVLHLLADSLGGGLAASSPTATELLRSISSLELHRAIVSRELALELGLDCDPTLQVLSERVPAEWKPALHAHRRALRSLAHQVQAIWRSPLKVDEGATMVVLPVTQTPMIQRSLREFLA